MGNKRHAKAWCIAEVDYHADKGGGAEPARPPPKSALAQSYGR